MSLFGVSYGAYVAQRYARAFPAARRPAGARLAGRAGPGRAVRRVELHGGRPRAPRRCCRCGRRAAGSWRALPLRGTAYDARGRPRDRSGCERAGELFDLLVSSDFSPALRAALPAAIAAAVRGDPAPLLRLVAFDRDTRRSAAADERNADAKRSATRCSSRRPARRSRRRGARPRRRSRPRRTRRAAALDALGRARARSVGRRGLDAGRHRVLPRVAADAGRGAARAGADRRRRRSCCPGAEDLRTPSEEARRTVAAIRDGTLVRVPGAGHAVVSQGLPCVQRALTRFFAGTAVGNPCDGADRRRGRSRPPAPRTLRAARRPAYAAAARRSPRSARDRRGRDPQRRRRRAADRALPRRRPPRRALLRAPRRARARTAGVRCG